MSTLQSLRPLDPSSRLLDEEDPWIYSSLGLEQGEDTGTLVFILILLIGVVTLVCFSAGIITYQIWERRGLRGNAEIDVQGVASNEVGNSLETYYADTCHSVEEKVERVSWYEYYLKAYSKILEPSDFKGENCEKDSNGVMTNTCCMVSIETSGRIVQAEDHCTFCLSSFQVGERVVWSSEDGCPHVFHYTCMMRWLVKGKKRCPICRYWFVPGLKLSTQIHGASSNRLDSSEAESYETDMTEIEEVDLDQSLEEVDV